MTFTANSKFVKSVKLDARGKVIKARYLIKQAEKKKRERSCKQRRHELYEGAYTWRDDCFEEFLRKKAAHFAQEILCTSRI